MALDQALADLDREAMASWFAARANPEAWKSYRKGAEAMKLRAAALLTGGS
jgi:plasmid stabilization system protein ParE